ncbi:MAG: filamentous hemagglutinin N-terminal domain-containing protein, partial [Cyanobacteria bacterium J06623_4]
MTAASAQVIAATDATATYTEVDGDRIDITGGQHASDQANLFHSFKEFDLAAEQTANFITTANVQNVIGRINSQQASTIDGTLQVTGSNADLYLVNPAGILLGPNSHLNLPGGFTATTATHLGFDDSQLTPATENYTELTGKPTTFYFDGSAPGSIVNQGDLSVQAGESIQLIGGTVVNEGQLTAPAGNITLAAVDGENLVRLSQSDRLLSFEIAPLEEAAEPTSVPNQAVVPTSLGEMLTGGSAHSATHLVTTLDGTVRLVGEDYSPSDSGGQVVLSGQVSAASLSGSLPGGDI